MLLYICPKVIVPMKTFTDFKLPKSLQKAIDKLGLKKPTPIQEKAFSVILSGTDIIGIAQTGTGKTLAYLLPILKQWQFQNTTSPRVVILVPTRELVVQVKETLEELTEFMSVQIVGVFGGVNINTQKKTIAEGIDILVGTPGRVMDLSLDGIIRFDALQKLVIDEFDEILNLGFRTQVTNILSMMKNKKQNILFSATMTEDVDEMITSYFNFPKEISLAPSGTPLKKIEQFAYKVPNFLTKINLLQHILETDNSSNKILIFVNNKKIAATVFEKLELLFPEQFGVIHSNKSQNYRLNTMANFKEGNLRGLITTDIMARGLDIANVSHVINLQFPEIEEQYIHRIGRTGRAEKKGVAISLISKQEEENVLAVEKIMKKDISWLPFPDTIIVEEQKMDFEKEKRTIKIIGKKRLPSSKGEAFHDKKEKNKKINLGGPGRRKPKKTKSRNRAVEAKRAAKRKKRR